MKYFGFLSAFLLQNFIWIPTRLFLVFFLRFHVVGLENLEGIQKGVIFAVNHSSEIDPILIPASLHLFSRYSPVFYLSREKKFYKNSGWRQIIYGGLFFKLWGAYPVRVGLNNYQLALNRHIELLSWNRSLCVFPEGKKTSDGYLQEAKGGVVYLAWKTSTPIVPVAINGAYKITFLDFLLCRRKVDVHFGKLFDIKKYFIDANMPIVTSERDEFREIAQKLMVEIRDLLEQK